MGEEKVIVIGCDDTTSLSVIVNSMKEISFSPHNIVTATRFSDLMGIVKSLNPDLIILSFRNNQLALNDFNAVEKSSKIPVICLTKNFENQLLYWSPETIVFAYPFEYIANSKCLGLHINSIFLIRNEQETKSEHNSFADAAIQLSQSSHNRNLSRYTLELDQKIEVLLKIKDRITELYPRVDDPTRAELSSIVNSIKMSANDNKLWDDFKLYFEQTNPDFLFLLAKKHPALTPIDLKYCCYLKMNMSNDDIRNLLGINQESVRTHKYRLKMKMSLAKDLDLRSYLISVGQKSSNFI